MNIIIFGPPGSGKGTQSELLAKNFSLYKISTGDLLRKEIKKNTILGEEIKLIVEKGNFVSDEIIHNLIAREIVNLEFSNKFVFDGYPRNINQANDLEKILEKHKQKIDFVFSLEVTRDKLLKRILSRIVCLKCGMVFNEIFNPPTNEHSCGDQYLEKRKDDNREILTRRLDTYDKETHQIFNFYQKKGLLIKINGSNDVKKIYEEITANIKT